MLEEFADIYDLHRWLRYATWAGLLGVAVFILWASGGFPPQAWLLLVQFIARVPQLWDLQGPVVLFPLLALIALSLLWLLAWVVLIGICVALVSHHQGSLRALLPGKFRRQRVEPDLDWLSFRAGTEAFQVLPLVSESEAEQTEGMGTVSKVDSRDDLERVESQGRMRRVDSGAMTATLTLDTATPRLRLPQRPSALYANPISPLPAVHATPEGYRSLQDVPTRPERHNTPGTLGKVSAPMLSMVASQPLEVGVGWNVGIKRQRNPNEDSVVVLQSACTYQDRLIPFGLFVVADGMGGHEHGLEASRIAMQSMMHTVLQNIVMGNELTDEFLVDMLIGGVEWANKAIYQRAQERGKEMGTTLTALLVVGMKGYVINIGDSRTYLYRENTGLLQITRDHSLVATLVSFGEIKPEEIYTHPERHKIYRCVGVEEHVEVDWFALDLRPHDLLLLCSDGLWEMVRDSEIQHVLRRNSDDPGRASDGLVQAALLGGGADNVSVVVVRVP
jgi:serine/threonine protein phosphatase PrpC